MSRYTLTAWYAEHATVGDKFYKTIEIFDTVTGKVVTVLQYGPRAVHVSLWNASVGQCSVIDGSGASKRNQKQRDGYTSNHQVETQTCADLDLLKGFAGNNFGLAVRDKLRVFYNAAAQVAGGGTTSPAPTFSPPPTSSVADLNQDLQSANNFGSW